MKKKSIIIFLYFLFNFSFVHSNQVEMFMKIDDEIITNIDIKNEYRYLASVKNLKTLNKNQLLEIAKKNVFSDKIKEIDLKKNFDDLILNNEYLNNVIENMYKNLNLNNFDEFLNYLETNNLTYEFIETKIKINFFWNRLIFMKYSNKIKIDEDKIKAKIKQQSSNKFVTKYNLSEIVFRALNEIEMNDTYNKILNDIKNVNFENAAMINSISDSKDDGGLIGWVTEDQINEEISASISTLKSNEISKPIRIANNFLVLKINEIDQIKDNENFETKVKNAILREQNFQLNQFSTIYFDRVKKNLIYNE